MASGWVQVVWDTKPRLPDESDGEAINILVDLSSKIWGYVRIHLPDAVPSIGMVGITASPTSTKVGAPQALTPTMH